MSARSTPPPPAGQLQARALGDPTRHRIFQELMAATGPMDVAQLTAIFGLNHNAIRQHLGILRDAELIVEERSGGGTPGRPRLLYRPHPEILGRWGSGGAFEELSHLLLQRLETGKTARETGRAAGAQRHGEVRAAGDLRDNAVALLLDDQARRGFRPHLEHTPEGTDLVVERCPYLSAAARDPHTVCQLHFGLAQGFVNAMDTDLEVAALEPHDPEVAGCRLSIRHKTPRPETPSLETPSQEADMTAASDVPPDAVIVDARPILAKGQEPFSTIMEAVENLGENTPLVVIAPFEPVPLQRTLSRRGFTWQSAVLDDGSWQVTFSRAAE